MKKIVCICLTILIMLCGCAEKEITKEEAVDTAEKIVTMLLTSNQERYSLFKETDVWKEKPILGESYDPEELYMYIPEYEEFCSSNAIYNLCMEDPCGVTTMDRYVDMTEYDKTTVFSIQSMIVDGEERDETICVQCTVHVAFWKGEVYEQESTGVCVDILKNDSAYGDGKKGQADLIYLPVSFVEVW